MTEAEVKRIAKDAAKEAVDEVFTRLGIVIADPIEMQKDFQHLRMWRLNVDTIKRQGIIAAVTTLVVGMLGLIWTAIKSSTPH